MHKASLKMTDEEWAELILALAAYKALDPWRVAIIKNLHVDETP